MTWGQWFDPSTARLAAQLSVEPCACEAPVPPDGGDRYLENGGDFVMAQATEDSLLDHGALSWVDRLQTLERIVQCHDIGVLLPRPVRRVRQGYLKLTTTAFGAALGPGDVNEDAAHDLGRQCKEVGAILPPHVFPVHQAYVRLVHERRRAKNVARPFRRHAPHRQWMELRLNQRCQRLERRPVAVAPCQEQVSDLRRRMHWEVLVARLP